MRIALLLMLSAIVSVADAEEKKPSRGKQELLKYSDCHIHLVDFFQQGEFENRDKLLEASDAGRNDRGRYPALRAGERWRRITHLLSCMDAGSIEHAMICGMPVRKKWSEIDTYERPGGYLDNESHLMVAGETDRIIAEAILDYREQFAESSAQLEKLQRISPFMCGIDPTDLGAVDQAVDCAKEFPGVWEGIGEIMCRHDDLTHLMLGERPRANHPALFRLCHFAAIHHLPVSIHHNIAPVSAQGSDRVPAYLDELVELFNRCSERDQQPATVFIWCHAGASRRVHVEDLPYWIDEVLQQFGKHVYIDLSWVVLDEYILDDIDAWKRLVEKHPANFIIGSDFVGGASGIGSALAKYEPFLRKLPSQTRRKIACDNFKNLLAKMKRNRREHRLTKGSAAGLSIDPNYIYPEYKHLERKGDNSSFVRSRLDEQSE